MKHILFGLLLLFSASADAQLTAQGYFYIVASGTDGIVVATDSRSSFYNSKLKLRYGYTDQSVRVLVVGNVAMAYSGNETFGGKYLSAIFEDFKKTLTSLPKVSEVLPLFLSYCSESMNAADYKLLLQNGFIVCGYENGKPAMCTQEDDIARECISEDWIRSAYDASDFEMKYSSDLTCNQIISIAESAIKKYAVDYKVQNQVGGPVRVLKITPAGIEWIQHKPTLQWVNTEDHFKAFIAGNASVTFLPKENKEKFISILRSNYPAIFAR